MPLFADWLELDPVDFAGAFCRAVSMPLLWLGCALFDEADDLAFAAWLLALSMPLLEAD